MNRRSNRDRDDRPAEARADRPARPPARPPASVPAGSRTRRAREGRRVTAKLLTAKQAGELLSVPPSWLLAQARRDEVPHVRLGKYRRFVEADLEAWIETVKRGPR